MPKKISSESSLAVQDEHASERKKHKKHSKRDSCGSSPSMPNKVASETSVAAQDEPASEPKKPKNQGNEIDEIFSNKKRKKPKQEQDNKPTEDVNPKLKKSKKEKKSKVARTVADPPVKSRRKTEDGLTVYAEEELGIGRADAGGDPNSECRNRYQNLYGVFFSLLPLLQGKWFIETNLKIKLKGRLQRESSYLVQCFVPWKA